MTRSKEKRAIRVVCFIDGSNLFSHLRDLFGSGKVHIPRLCHYLTGDGREFIKWRYYIASLPQGSSPREMRRYSAQQRFFNYIQFHRKGMLRLGRFQRDRSGALREKGVDVLLAVDLVRLAAENLYDVAILLSGDGDLVPAIQTVQQIYRKRVEVALPRIPAYHVRQVADAYLEITRSMFERVKL